MSTVAVIMASYNGEKYVRQQIESIFASGFGDFEIFIYDDGSKDNTIGIISELEQQHPGRIHLHQNETNLGVTRNFLQAVARAEADYIMLCDQDDVWKPNKIEKTLNRMKALEKRMGRDLPLAVFTDAVIVDERLSKISDSFFRFNHLNPKKTDLAHILMENKLIGCTVMVNAFVGKLLKQYPIPEHARFHDWWIALLASSMGKISFIDEGTLYYRQHGGNLVGGTGFISYLKNRLANIQRQKDALMSLYRQAEDFLAIYDEILPQESKRIIREFASIPQMGFFSKRLTLIRNGYLKSGLIRNLGLMLIV